MGDASCAVCGTETPGGGMMSSRGEVCAGCFDQVEAPRAAFPPLLVAALVCGALPFFVKVVSSSQGSFMDYVAVACGGAAVVLGGVLAAGISKAPNKSMQLGYAALAVGVGAFQLLRGFGILLIGYG